MKLSVILSGVALVLALAALVLGWLAYDRVSQPSNKADNLIQAMQDLGAPVQDDGTLEERPTPPQGQSNNRQPTRPPQDDGNGDDS